MEQILIKPRQKKATVKIPAFLCSFMSLFEKAKYNRLVLFFTLIAIAGCGTFYDKDDYVQEYQQFVEEVKTDYKSYSVEDWEFADQKYDQFSVKDYENFKEQLTREDMQIISQLKGTYALIKLKKGANDLIDQSKDLIDQAKGAVDGVVESINN